MSDPVTWWCREIRRLLILWRLRRHCPHPQHRVFEFEEPRRSGLFCEDCQATLVMIRLSRRAERTFAQHD